MGNCSSNQNKYLSKQVHDIRSLINPIPGAVSLLNLTKLTIEQKKYLQILENSTKQLLSKLNEISTDLNSNHTV